MIALGKKTSLRPIQFAIDGKATPSGESTPGPVAAIRRAKGFLPDKPIAFTNGRDLTFQVDAKSRRLEFRRQSNHKPRTIV